MKLKNILFAVAAVTTLTACEDYTEHNFGKDEELWQATQVNAHVIELTDANYQDIARNEDNIKLALSADDDSTTYEDLQSVASLKYFRKGITPEEYLPAMLKNLVGISQYYCMTPGSTITIKCKVANDSLASGDAFVPATTFSEGDYLMVAKGEEQVLAGGNMATTGKTYSYIYESGSETFPTAVTRISDTAIQYDANAQQYLFKFVKEGDHFLIMSPEGEYLYMEGTYNNFYFASDLGDLDESDQAWWTVVSNGDGTWDITNVNTGKIMLYGTKYSSAGAYADKKGEEGYLGIELYKKGSINVIVDSTPEEQEIKFTLGEDGVWAAKADYLNQSLTTTASTDAETVFAIHGWSFEYASSLGELTYVWSATTAYGLKASAFKSSKSYPTDSWAISPKMNFKKAKEPLFTFEEAQKYAGTPVSDFLKVYVSTNYSGRGGQASATWTEVTDQLTAERPDGSSWNFTSQSLDLSAYAGETNVVVAFRYISTDAVAATWEFKNVRCAEKSDFEVAE